MISDVIDPSGFWSSRPASGIIYWVMLWSPLNDLSHPFQFPRCTQLPYPLPFPLPYCPDPIVDS
eukprot:7742402-Pyramimonas_sp.AAC.1